MPDNKRLVEFWKSEAEAEQKKVSKLENRVKFLENRLLYLDDDGTYDSRTDGNIKDSLVVIVFLILMALGVSGSVVAITYFIINGFS